MAPARRARLSGFDPVWRPRTGLAPPGEVASSGVYEPRSPGAGALYRVVRDQFETFLAEAASLRDGDGVPRFVEHAFRRFLRCGRLAGGFARFRCGGCGVDRLVPFSCKGRAVCPSCAGRHGSPLFQVTRR